MNNKNFDIKYKMIFHNITVKQIADKLGTSRGYISNILNRSNTTTEYQKTRILKAINEIVKEREVEIKG